MYLLIESLVVDPFSSFPQRLHRMYVCMYVCMYGEPFVPKVSVADDKTQSLVLKFQSLVLKYQSLVIKVNR